MTRKRRLELERMIEDVEPDEPAGRTEPIAEETREAVEKPLDELPSDAADEDRREAVREALAERYGVAT